MPDWLSIHEPVLVNTIGHCAGAVIFGMLLYYFALDWRRREERSSLPAVAAGLAMLWNIGSLVALASGPRGGRLADIIVAASFSVLSVLPAVLLQISLESQYRGLAIGGYALSAAAVGLHAGDLVTHSSVLHYAALRLVTVGFAILAIIPVGMQLRKSRRAALSRLPGALGLFLFAISIAHFSAGHARQAWSSEAALHHAGLPLALLVILQDFRFLLMDAFLRFVVNAVLAAAALLISIRAIESPWLARHLRDPFSAGWLFVSAGVLLTLFVYLHNRAQGWLTRVIFLRLNVEQAVEELQHGARSTRTEEDYLALAAEVIGRFLRARRFELAAAHVVPAESWVQAVAPWRFSRGDARYLLLGQRAGGRRYLSEDFAVLARLSGVVVEHVEQVRAIEMENLVAQAELKTLQAQINPHFLFNSLNTLYGTIDRSNTEARRLVLNLSDIYRYLLRTDRTFIEVEEELKIVRAYLEIEELRLGGKLRTQLAVDDAALRAPIPMLSIQPLVENAVRHGVAARAGNGFVRLRVAGGEEGVSVEISNSGECDPRALENPGHGIGLKNVRRRLELCYGGEARFAMQSAAGITTISFAIPLRHAYHMAAV
jgi:two-component system LytT family sensor kinase